MIDFTERAPVLDATRLAQGPHPYATLQPVAPAAQFIFRGDANASAAIAAPMGFSPPARAGATAQADARAALWLGPDEWLLLLPLADGARVQAVAAALEGTPHSWVAVGHRNSAIELSGSRAALLLNAGCPRDLDERAFPVGAATRTILAKAQIVLWRTAPDTFYINVWRSFLPYVWDYLIEARTLL